MEEIWKDIEGYEGLYQVSNLGRVRSLSRKYTALKEQEMQKGKQVVNKHIFQNVVMANKKQQEDTFGNTKNNKKSSTY